MSKTFNKFSTHQYIYINQKAKKRKLLLFKCGTNIYFFTLQRFGPSPSPNFEFLLLNYKTVKKFQTMLKS